MAIVSASPQIASTRAAMTAAIMAGTGLNEDLLRNHMLRFYDKVCRAPVLGPILTARDLHSTGSTHVTLSPVRDRAMSATGQFASRPRRAARSIRNPNFLPVSPIVTCPGTAVEWDSLS
ncbi:hypothetical protein [Thioclava sp.]|uniref:hypothetical protein n=1 Tax=Thioclava sp. TaxID=1933450 RepID=UPI003AA820BB